MSVNENVFFREATLRICSSLDIETALKHCFEYIRGFIPVVGMSLHVWDADLNLVRFVASVGANLPEGSEKVLSLPEKGRNERAALLEKGEIIHIANEPDPKLGLQEIQERLGLNPNISMMSMALKLEGNRIGSLGLVADGSPWTLCHCHVQCAETSGGHSIQGHAGR
jgi:hydrogenase-4 transcriptional activator